MIRGPVKLEKRILDIAPGFAGFVYYQEECVKRKIGICWDYDIIEYKYDLTNPDVRKQLIAMGFKASVNRR